MKNTVLLFGIAFSLLIVSCSKDDEVDKLITLESSVKTLYFGDEYQIEATSNTPLLYSSDDEYHASVSELGLVTARFIGETNIVLSNGNDTKKVSITVKAQSNLYPDPNLEFGTSKSALLAKYGTPDVETETVILYDNYSNAAEAVMYLFDDNNNLKSSAVMVKTAYSSNLGTFLVERYLTVDRDNLIFVNALEPENATMLIGADLYNLSYWLVVYVPYSSTTMSSQIEAKSISSEFDNLFHQLKKMDY
ncbi:MAG: hypothetical protein ACQEWG_06100 [Bacteroidota bacterium]